MIVKKLAFFLWIFFTPLVLLSQGNLLKNEAIILVPGKTQQIPVVLNGPNQDCMPIDLLVETVYSPQDEHINLTIKCVGLSAVLGKHQYTHLWIPLFQNDGIDSYKSLKQYFKSELNYAMTKGAQFKSQVRDLGGKSFKFTNSFQCDNGKVMLQGGKSLLYSLSDDTPLTLNVAVNDISKPVQLTLHDIIAVNVKSNVSFVRKSANLKFITKDCKLVFSIDEGNCSGSHEELLRYRQLNQDLKKEYQDVLAFRKSKNVGGSCEECDSRQMVVLAKYWAAKRDISETQCEELKAEYDEFQKCYNGLGVGIITPDSLSKMVLEMDSLLDELSTARNTGQGQRCRLLKGRTGKYNRVTMDANLFNDVPEMKELVSQFNLRKEMLNGIRCPSAQGGSCQLDAARIRKATAQINAMMNDYIVRKSRKDKEFGMLVKDTDSYINSFSTKCKKRYSDIIKQYEEAKKAFKEIVR